MGDVNAGGLKPVLAKIARELGAGKYDGPVEIPNFKIDTLASLLSRQIGPDFRQPDSVARRAADALAKRTSNPVAVHQKFEDLRAMNIEGLNNFVCILEKISVDNSLARALGGHPAPSQAPPQQPAAREVFSERGAPATAHQDRFPPESVPASVDISAISLASERHGMADPASPHHGMPAAPLHRHAHPPASERPRQHQDALYGPVMDAIGDLLSPCQAAQSAIPGDFSVPSWLIEREFLNGDHLLSQLDADATLDAEATSAPISAFTPDVQEQLLVDDLLYAMLGFGGRYLRLTHVGEDGASAALRLVDGVEPALRDLALRLVPLCQDALIVQRFVQKRQMSRKGLVAQALAAAIQGYMEEWGVMVAQLEHLWRQGRLTLQGMLFYCQPAISALHVLSVVASEAAQKNLGGADLLNMLARREKEMAGNPAARALLRELMVASAEPYMRMLQRWIAEGVLDDPYGEFLVTESGEGREKGGGVVAAWWSTRFRIRGSVPEFLKEHKGIILDAGKYLTAIKEHRVPVEPPLAPGTRLTYAPESRMLRKALVGAYETVSRQLVRVVLEKGSLMQRLETMRRFFLTAQGDLLVHFMDLADEDLKKKIHLCSRDRVQALFEVAVRSTGAGGDPFAEHISVAWERNSMKRALSVLYEGGEEQSGPIDARKRSVDCLVLKCDIEGPAALVISPTAVRKYQALFRHIFFVKTLERRLASALLGLMTCRVQRDPSVLEAQRRVQKTLQQMSQFVQHYQSYMFLEVLEPAFADMTGKVKAAATVDEAMEAHNAFLDKSIHTLLMYQSPRAQGQDSMALLVVLYQVLALCGEFSESVASAMSQLPEENAARLVNRAFNEYVAVRREQFGQALEQLLAFLTRHAGDDQALMSLAGRLDYNEFFSRARQGRGGVDALRQSMARLST